MSKTRAGIKTRKNDAQVRGTIQAWADSLGKDPASIKRHLNSAGIKFRVGEEIDAVDIFRAFTADTEKDRATARKLTAEAESRERKNKIESGQLLDLTEIEKVVWGELLMPLRQALESMPRDIAPLLAGQPAEAVQRNLENWVETTKNKIQSKNYEN